MKHSATNIRLATQRVGFKRGDVVGLKCGGPKMVVVKPYYELSSDQQEMVTVMFWNDNVDLRETNLDPNSLIKIEDEM